MKYKIGTDDKDSIYYLVDIEDAGTDVCITIEKVSTISIVNNEQFPDVQDAVKDYLLTPKDSLMLSNPKFREQLKNMDFTKD